MDDVAKEMAPLASGDNSPKKIDEEVKKLKDEINKSKKIYKN